MAEAVVQEMLEHPWRLRFSQFAGRAPVIIVGPLLNRTHDQLHTQALLKELQRALVNSGQFQAVADAGQRQEVRQERAEQGPPSRPESLKSGLQEPGADFILQGSISIMVERHENTTTTSYQVSLELLDIASAIKVWVGQKKLKPLLARGQTTL
ncbi:MAG: penicillin-binding protein activator LpoB [Candidatus Tectimicrobiota bacterium]